MGPRQFRFFYRGGLKNAILDGIELSCISGKIYVNFMYGGQILYGGQHLAI